MKQIKIILIINLILLFLLINTSCINNTSGLSSQPGNESNIPSSSEISYKLSSESSTIPDISGRGNQWVSKKLEVGFIGPGSRDLWLTMFTKNIFDTADDWNIDLEYCDGQGKQDLQIKHIEKLIEKKVDAIGFMPVWESGWDQILAKAKDAGIPIILVDTTVDSADESLWTSYIVNDWEKEGRMAGEWLINYLEKEGRMNEKIKIAEISGTEDAGATIGRGQNFRKAIKDYSNIEIMISKEGHFTQAKGHEEMANILSETTDIDVLFCHNDDMALGAIQAIEEAGLVPGKDIIIISIEGTNAALEAIVDDKIACSVECNPLMGDLFMEACVRLANGEEIEREIHPVDRVFDITNAQAEINYRKLKGYGY